MSYRLDLGRQPRQFLARVGEKQEARWQRRLREIREGPYQAGTKLRGREDYRARVGDYRILYYIDDGEQVVNVWRIAHRRDVYDDL